MLATMEFCRAVIVFFFWYLCQVTSDMSVRHVCVIVLCIFVLLLIMHILFLYLCQKTSDVCHFLATSDVCV
jgi:hypothetical protein